MITIKKYQPMNIDGPYLRKARTLDYIVNIIGLAAIGVLLAVSVLGMTGAMDDKPASMTLACVSCAGGVGK